MPCGARKARSCCTSSIWRFWSGMMMVAICSPSRVGSDGVAVGLDAKLAAQHLEEELVNLDVTPGLVQVAAPGVQPVTPDQKAVPQRVVRVFEALLHAPGQCGDVLAVGEDLDPLAGLVRGEAGPSPAHLVDLVPPDP